MTRCYIMYIIYGRASAECVNLVTHGSLIQKKMFSLSMFVLRKSALEETCAVSRPGLQSAKIQGVGR